MLDFVFPSDADRAESEALDRACAEIERLLESLEVKDQELINLAGERRGELMNADGLTYRQPPDGWVCFHCGQRMMTYVQARHHFGNTPAAVPLCLHQQEPD